MLHTPRKDDDSRDISRRMPALPPLRPLPAPAADSRRVAPNEPLRSPLPLKTSRESPLLLHVMRRKQGEGIPNREAGRAMGANPVRQPTESLPPKFLGQYAEHPHWWSYIIFYTRWHAISQSIPGTEIQTSTAPSPKPCCGWRCGTSRPAGRSPEQGRGVRNSRIYPKEAETLLVPQGHRWWRGKSSRTVSTLRYMNSLPGPARRKCPTPVVCECPILKNTSCWQSGTGADSCGEPLRSKVPRDPGEQSGPVLLDKELTKPEI